ncbi:hypothetical protein [Paludibacterium yongneupense]|uniref:hypothetical protein n=2 Tax=Paludibacterium yongneupense TaxID=400061 RepID=UPI0003F9227B|nr:hypothetical protein [Paludibacterium yongneupense]
MNMSMSAAGALPAESEDYKVETAGLDASLKSGDPAGSHYNWVFSFAPKRDAALEYVLVDKVHPDGSLERVLDDRAPVFRDGSWYGRSVEQCVECEAAAWMYTVGDSLFLFRITVKPCAGEETVMLQPALITGESKAHYGRVLAGQRS